MRGRAGCKVFEVVMSQVGSLPRVAADAGVGKPPAESFCILHHVSASPAYGRGTGTTHDTFWALLSLPLRRGLSARTDVKVQRDPMEFQLLADWKIR